MTAGGNDVELKNILNQCIFQWAVLNQEQVLVAKTAALLDKQYKWAQDWDWDALGRRCEGQCRCYSRVFFPFPTAFKEGTWRDHVSSLQTVSHISN